MSTYFDYIKVGDNLTGATLNFFGATPSDISDKSGEVIIETSTGAKFTYSSGAAIILEGVGDTIRRFDLSESSTFTLPENIEAGIVTSINTYSDSYKYIQIEKEGIEPIFGFKGNKSKREVASKEEVAQLKTEITELLNTKLDNKVETIIKEDSDIKMKITARRQLNIVNLYVAMTFKTTEILVGFDEAIPVGFRPTENIEFRVGNEPPGLLFGTNGTIAGSYVDQLPPNINITYIVDE